MRIDASLPYRTNYLDTSWIDWGEQVNFWIPENAQNKEVIIHTSGGKKVFRCEPPCYIEVTK